MQFEISLLLLRAFSIDTLGSPWPVRILRSENRMVGKSLSKKLMLSILGLVWAGSSMFTSKLRMRSIVIDYTKCYIILRCPQCKPQITEAHPTFSVSEHLAGQHSHKELCTLDDVNWNLQTRHNFKIPCTASNCDRSNTTPYQYINSPLPTTWKTVWNVYLRIAEVPLQNS